MLKRRQKIRTALLVISFVLFPVTIYYHSPSLVIEGFVHGILAGSGLLFIAQFLLGLFFGRAWCGWLCVGGGVDEICKCIQPKPSPAGKADWIKWILWVPWVTVMLVLLYKNRGVHSIEAAYQTWHGISLHDMQSYIVFYVMILVFMGAALWLGRRAFCRYICWMAPFMILGRKLRNVLRLPALSLKANTKSCTQCKKCDKNCPMNLSVSQMVRQHGLENTECILCGMCIDTCPQNVLSFGFGGFQKTTADSANS